MAHPIATTTTTTTTAALSNPTHCPLEICLHAAMSNLNSKRVKSHKAPAVLAVPKMPKTMTTEMLNSQYEDMMDQMNIPEQARGLMLQKTQQDKWQAVVMCAYCPPPHLPALGVLFLERSSWLLRQPLDYRYSLFPLAHLLQPVDHSLNSTHSTCHTPPTRYCLLGAPLL